MQKGKEEEEKDEKDKKKRRRREAHSADRQRVPSFTCGASRTLADVPMPRPASGLPR